MKRKSAENQSPAKVSVFDKFRRPCPPDYDGEVEFEIPDVSVTLYDRQRTRTIARRFLLTVIQNLLTSQLRLYNVDIVVRLVNAAEMTNLNETRLHHAGSTDVITFDYSDSTSSPMLVGELFVCVDEAILQARRFKVTWQTELVRYIVHGVLHLRGFDDTRAAARRRMKSEEDRLVRELARDFNLSKLQRKPRVSV
jgi:probable rRNA maturation factor